MTECIDLAAIKEGDLMAYLEGDTEDRVREHVENCSVCADEVARLRETSRGLLTLMYRADCPAPEILAQYQMDLLSNSDQLEVAAHVRTCPHCARELEELVIREEEEDSLTQMILHVLEDVVQTVEATMTPRGRPHPVGVRGTEDGGRTFHFHADDPSTVSEATSEQAVDVLIGFQPGTPATGTRTLLGSVVQTEAVSGGRAWLFREGDKPVSSLVDHLGTFTFTDLAPGEYDLALEVGQKALLMRGVVV
jgi:hypothetical protein